MTFTDGHIGSHARAISLILKTFYSEESQEVLDEIRRLFAEDHPFYLMCMEIRALHKKAHKVLERDLKSPYKESLLKRNENEEIRPSKN